MGDALMDPVLDAFNADPTPGPRAAMLHRLLAEYKERGWTRRMVYDLLVASEWDEDTARKAMEGRLQG